MKVPIDKYCREWIIQLHWRFDKVGADWTECSQRTRVFNLCHLWPSRTFRPHISFLIRSIVFSLGLHQLPMQKRSMYSITVPSHPLDRVRRCIGDYCVVCSFQQIGRVSNATVWQTPFICEDANQCLIRARTSFMILSFHILWHICQFSIFGCSKSTRTFPLKIKSPCCQSGQSGLNLSNAIVIIFTHSDFEFRTQHAKNGREMWKWDPLITQWFRTKWWKSLPMAQTIT